mgnify:FL=1
MQHFKFLLLLIIAIQGFSFSTLNGKASQVFSYENALIQKVTLISANEKVINVLVEHDGLINQSNFASVFEVNSYFEKIDGIIMCSYSWNGGTFKFELERSKAKEILINFIKLDPTQVNTLF